MLKATHGSCGILWFIWALAACGGAEDAQPIQATVTGSAQKGPFISGSTVRIAELDADLIQTGRLFSALIDDDSGSYSVRGVQLGTPFARVEVTGRQRAFCSAA
jgi:hypothetical protein